MGFCPFCGKPIDDADRFCGHCGRDRAGVRAAKEETAATAHGASLKVTLPTGVSFPNRFSPRSLTRRQKLILAVGVGAVVIVAGYVGIGRALATPERTVRTFFAAVAAGKADRAAALLAPISSDVSDLTKAEEMRDQFKAWLPVWVAGSPPNYRYEPNRGTAGDVGNLMSLFAGSQQEASRLSNAVGFFRYTVGGNQQLMGMVERTGSLLGVPRYGVVLERNRLDIVTRLPGAKVVLDDGLEIKTESDGAARTWVFSGPHKIKIEHPDAETMEARTEPGQTDFEAQLKPSKEIVDRAAQTVERFLRDYYLKAAVQQKPNLLDGGPIAKDGPYYSQVSQLISSGPRYLQYALDGFEVTDAAFGEKGAIVLGVRERYSGKYETQLGFFGTYTSDVPNNWFPQHYTLIKQGNDLLIYDWRQW